MTTSILSLILKKTPMRSRTPETCIVNDAHGGRKDICGRSAVVDRECPPPACTNHLCQHRRSNGHKCKSTPIRLAHGNIYARGGWFPDMRRSVNCRRHEKYNCVQLMNGSVRCSGVKVPGLDYCAAHAALLCKWKVGEGVLCAELAFPGSKYCMAHCWCESLFLETLNRVW